jgi:hypothetical protein
MNTTRSFKDMLISLLTSRKFWLAFVVSATSVYLYVTGAIDADLLVKALVSLGTVLALAIAGEDISKNLRK